MGITKTYKSNEQRIKEEEEALEQAKKEFMEEQEKKSLAEEEGSQEEAVEEIEEDLEPEEATWKDRYGNLRRHSSDKEKTLKDQIKDLEKKLADKPSVVSDVEFPKTEKELQQWQEKFPDMARIMDRLVEKKAAEMFKQAEQKFEQYDKVTEDLAFSQFMSKVRKRHPDVDEVVAHDNADFHGWVESQPKWFSDMIYDQFEDSDSVIRILDIYKREKGLTKQDNKKRDKDAVKNVTSGSKPNISTEKEDKKLKESDIQRMSPQEYSERQEEIKAKLRKGEIIMDISAATM